VQRDGMGLTLRPLSVTFPSSKLTLIGHFVCQT
jgi:hypothetical protein